MRSNRHSLLVAILLGTLAAVPAVAQTPAPAATAALFDRNGDPVGSVLLHRMPRGTLLDVRLEGLPVGAHGFHVHQTGTCEPPFDSAGGHYNPGDAAHGFATENGEHAGDLPNVHIPASGRLEVEMYSRLLQANDQLFDEDGAAIVIHEGADDYASQPAGAAGPRIACGVIEPT
jgi:Cu-Zn family superoxide dismutase